MFFYDDQILKVGKYIKLITVTEKEIKIEIYNNRQLIILGNDLKISFFDKSEVNIIGKIQRIEIYENV